MAGTLTRRYHGLLVAALKPPLGRILLCSKVDEIVEYDGLALPLFANRWAGNTIDPHGYRTIERFTLEGTTPAWTYAVADALIEKRVWMEQGANTTYVRYHVLRARGRLALKLKAFVNYRDYHGSTRGDDWQMDVVPVTHGSALGRSTVPRRCCCWPMARKRSSRILGIATSTFPVSASAGSTRPRIISTPGRSPLHSRPPGR
jgi:glycogen debranching enzyme